MKTPSFIILGSSAGRASAHRAGSCYLLDLNDHGVLIDCGDGATRSFLHAGYQTDWVSHLIISHTHADHVGGVPYFIQQRYLTGTGNPLTIYCPAEAIAALKSILAFGYMFAEHLPFAIEFRPIAARQFWEIGDLRLTAYPTSHLTAQRAHAEKHRHPNRGECYAFQINVNRTSMVYSADLGSLDDLNQIADRIDWLLIETSHVPLDRLWPWVEERGIRRVILTHFSDDFDFSGLADGAKYTSAEILAASDGMSLELP